jgi:hypothetical protein
MEINKEFAVIIPVHKLENDTENQLLAEAIKSVLGQEVQPGHLLLVTPTAVPAAVTRMTETELFTQATGKRPNELLAQHVINKYEANFQGQVNAAVVALPEEVKYFTILEFDDALRPNYFRHAQKYTQGYPDAAVLLPIVEDVDGAGKFLKYTNEVLWTPNFTDNLGVLDHEALKGYANFHLTGAVIKKSAFHELGGLKESFQLVFNYEFLLRATQKDLLVCSIPKVLYNHVDGREGSLFKTLTEGRGSLIEEEVRFWFDAAHRECFFTEDRKITYQPA